VAFPFIFSCEVLAIVFELAGFPPGPPMGLELCPEQPFLSCSPESHSFRWVGLSDLLSIYLKKKSHYASHSRTTPTPLDRETYFRVIGNCSLWDEKT